MNNKAFGIAIILVAAYAISTRASAEEVYRCGNNYSQKPCPDAVKLDVDDSRTAAQKAAADANTRRDTATANSLEKARLAEEARQRAAQAKLAAAQAKKAATKPKTTASQPGDADTQAAASKAKKKKTGKKPKKGPDFFTAQGPAANPKTPVKAPK